MKQHVRIRSIFMDSMRRKDEVQAAMPDVDMSSVEAPINPDEDKFPFCIVWTPIPLITYEHSIPIA